MAGETAPSVYYPNQGSFAERYMRTRAGLGANGGSVLYGSVNNIEADIQTLQSGSIFTYDLNAENFSAGSPIDTLADQSPNGRDATQATASKRPTMRVDSETLKSAEFVPGNAQDLKSTVFSATSEPFTSICLQKFDNLNTNNYWPWATTATDAGNGPSAALTQSGAFAIYSGNGLQSGSTDDALWHVFVGVFRSIGGSSLYRDGGTSIANLFSVVKSFNRITVGANYNNASYWDGKINFLSIYPGNLQTDNLSLLNAVGSALATRAGITWTNMT